MYSDFCTQQACTSYKFCLTSVLLLIAISVPYFSSIDREKGVADLENFCQKMKLGSQESQSDITFEQFVRALSQNPYQGVWMSSIKQSKLLKQQNGTIQLKTKQKTQENQQGNYIIEIKIYDGRYRDDSYYEIKLDSSSIKTEQQIALNQVIFETSSPIIGLIHKKRIFNSQKQKPIFINKLKFRLNLQSSLKIELLLAAEYQINIITESLERTWVLLSQIVFCCVIVLQVVIQAFGTYQLMTEAQSQNLLAYSISPTFLKFNICFDAVEIYVLFYIIYYENANYLMLPACILYAYFAFLSTYLHSIVSNVSISYKQQIEHQTANNSENQNVSQSQFSPLFTNSSVKSLVTTMQKCQNYLMYLCSYLVFYLNNMQNYLYILFFLIVFIPQIVRNSRLGNKLNYGYTNLLLMTCPKIMPLLYVRFFGLKTNFLLQPHYLFCVALIVLAVIGSLLIYIQNQYGARSILPKFLIPKGMKTKFKFFAIQDENVVCIVCRSDLSQIPPELRKNADMMGLKQQITYNKVVLTPCHHKFHAHCLQKWMENRTQCPSCNYKLPPSEVNRQEITNN